ncbi:MAG: ferredoxin, partial [Sulfurovaceae bacterium]|nr:ferredoxin [Sulfurovaceae bacterium]
DAPTIKYSINKASKHYRARVCYMHPIEDNNIQNIVTQFIKYDAMSEEGAVALLAYTLLKDKELPNETRAILDDLDIGNLSAESNIGEEELETLRKSLIKKVGYSLVVGADLYSHPRAKNIAKMVALIEKYAGFNVICVPPAGNGMGISLICDLDDNIEGITIGYNVKGDFTLSALGGGDLDMPSLIQQEGTLTSIGKRVVPINVALDYGGYVLNDIANALGLNVKYTIEYTKQLPLEKGFKSIDFDSLPNYFDISGNEHRGYLLSEIEVNQDGNIEEPVEVEGIDGAVVYNCNPQEHFSPFTAKSKILPNNPYLLGSKQFSTASKLNDGDSVKFVIDNIKFTRVFKIDTSLKGTIALNPTYDMGLST